MTPTVKPGIRSRTAWRLGAALLLAVLPGTVRAADAPPAASKPADDPFAVLHARLEAKADEVLLRAASAEDPRPASGSSGQGEGVAGPAMDPAAWQRFAQRHWNGQERPLRRAVERISGLRAVVEPILKEEGVPPEILGLLLVESGGNPAALSPQGARGLWQFMPATARRYGLRVSYGTDERLDVERSTRAAARHLRDLYELFGSWPLALAAYNAGDRAVQKAIRRGKTTDFATLSSLRLLPAETRAYVPAVLAAAPLFGSATLQQTGQWRNRREIILYAAPAEPGAELTAK
jgi:membrane-bound lytic murein transglycosylase D